MLNNPVNRKTCDKSKAMPSAIPTILPLSSGEECSAKYAPIATGLTPAMRPNIIANEKDIAKFNSKKAIVKTDINGVINVIIKTLI